MRQQEFASTAQAPERPRLVPPWLLALLTGMVLLVLVAIYPRDALVDLVRKAQGSDIAEAYLNNLLRADPDNPGLRLAVARMQLGKGQWERARESLGPALAANDQALRREASRLLWESLETQFDQAPKDSPQREELRAELSRRLPDMVDWQMSEDDLAFMARKAFFVGNQDIGIGIFEHLAEAHPAQRDYWYGEAARESLANSGYRAAANFYMAAARQSENPTQRRQYFRDALRALQSGDQAGEALELAGRNLQDRPDLADDKETLKLLVTLARAARRPDLADRYARSLMRLSLLEQWQDGLRAAQGLDAGPRLVALTGQDLRGASKLSFDNQAYTLSFASFIDNHKLDDAWNIAASAVRQAPDDVEWRRRLAEVSEWTGRPRVALDHWLYLARSTGRDDAWQAVLRLAPGLFDDGALVAALRHRLASQPDDRRLLSELVAAYERQGDPRAALKLLEGQAARRPQAWVLEQLAGLSERMGDDPSALAYWQRYLAASRTNEPRPDQAIHIATLMLRQGSTGEALALLEKAGPQAGTSDQAFWRFTARVAQMHQRGTLAIAAYRRIIASTATEEADYEALQWLLSDDYPLEAAQVAAAAWRRYGKPAHLVFALDIYSQHQRWSDVASLLAGLDAGQMGRLKQDPRFLRHSALYQLHGGSPQEARRQMEAALRLAPQSPDIQQAYLWLLIESHDAAALRRVLATSEEAWSDNTDMHDALAAAYQAMSLPDVALRRYLTPRLAEHRGDFLWLMNYADVLEQNRESDRAWRIRQHLFADQRRLAARAQWLTELGPEAQAEVRRIARARLLISQGRGDPGAAALRELLRLDRDADKQLSRAAREVAAGWLLEAGQYRAERGWLWQQFAGSASRPLWAEMSVALAEDDREPVGQLLDRYGESLPRIDRITAARRVGNIRLAQTDAFETLNEQPFDDELHWQLVDALLAFRNDLGADAVWRSIGSVSEAERSARWQLKLNPGLGLLLNLGSIARSSGDNTVIGTAPHEHFRGIKLAWRHDNGETRLAAEERHGLATYRPLLLEHEHDVDRDLQVILAVGQDLPSSDSIALRLAGRKDRASLALRYRASRRDRVFAEHAFERFGAQTGDSLGTGHHTRLEYAHALRLQPWSLEASAFWSDHRYRPEGGIASSGLQPILPAGIGAPGIARTDFFLPDDFRFYGVRLSTDTRLQQEYNRAFRPYASVAATRNSMTGSGYDLSAGIAGSVLGPDRLQFDWSLTKGGQTTGSLVRQFHVGYQLDY